MTRPPEASDHIGSVSATSYERLRTCALRAAFARSGSHDWTPPGAATIGTFNRDFYAESNVRVGDVVELYVYSGPGATTPTGTQLADLASEKTVPVNGTGSWQVSVPIAPDMGLAPAQCRIAVQSTHAFMGAGDAGG